jgi:catechol 2,3-dioxygenase-like lactoylglutathione lyase family enzyme
LCQVLKLFGYLSKNLLGIRIVFLDVEFRFVINLKTLRLQEMIDWYATVLGMETQYQFPGGAWFTNDAANNRTTLLVSPVLSEDESMGDLLDAYARLKALGIELHASLDHRLTCSLYYEDPDGNRVELQTDKFGSWEESSEWYAPRWTPPNSHWHACQSRSDVRCASGGSFFRRIALASLCGRIWGLPTVGTKTWKRKEKTVPRA